LEFRGRAEDQVAAVGGEPAADEARLFSAGARVQRTGHALHQFTVRTVDGDSDAAVAEAGRAEVFTPEGEGTQPVAGFAHGGCEGPRRRRAVGRNADIFRRPPAVGPPRRYVRVDAMVGRFAGPRDAAVVDPVENPRRALGIRVAAERFLPG